MSVGTERDAGVEEREREFVAVSMAHAVAVVIAETGHVVVGGETVHRLAAVMAHAAAIAAAVTEQGVVDVAKERDVASEAAGVGVGYEAMERSLLAVARLVAVGVRWVWTRWSVVSEAVPVEERPVVARILTALSVSASAVRPDAEGKFEGTWSSSRVSCTGTGEQVARGYGD